MDQHKPNYIAIIIAAGTMWILGARWYTMFGTQWMAYTNATEVMTKSMTGADMAMAYGGSLIAYLIAFYVQDHMMFAFKAKNVNDGLQGGFWTWLIDGGYWLAGLVVGSIILVKMKKKEVAATN